MATLMADSTAEPGTGGDLAPPPALLPRLHTLWDEIADHTAADIDAALGHLLQSVADLLSAQNAYWLGTVRVMDDEEDALRGWRPRSVRYLHTSAEYEEHARKSIRDFARGGHDESGVAHARAAGRFRVSVIRELVTPAWFESSMYKFGYEARGIVDALFVVFPLHESAEAFYGFQRTAPMPPFGQADKAIAGYAIRGLKWFHRQVMLSHGLLVARAPLTPNERRVVRLLLTDLTEKEIADRLGLTTTTTHKYVTDIFRKFGVSGRPGLTALWLGRTS
jgi:DNA-binding CsgD family transcriptional regulator